jgi:hypothetical protein
MRAFLILLLLSVGFSATLMAQVYTGEVIGETNAVTENPKVRKQSSTSSGKEKFVQITYFMPSMTPEFFYPEGPFIPTAGPGFGALLEFGGFRFFSDNFMINDMANIGLFSSFGMGVELHDFDLPDDFDGQKIPFLFLDYKLGPDFRFEVSDNLKFDLYADIGVLLSYGGYVDGTLVNSGFAITYMQKSPVITLQTGVGFNVVLLDRLILGTHFTFANGAYKYDIDMDNANSTEKTYDVLLNSVRISIGLIR